MALEVRMIEHSGFLEFVVTGEYELDDAIEKFRFVLEACKLSNNYKVLINILDLKGRAEGLEQTLYPFGVEDIYRDYLRKGGEELSIAYLDIQLDTSSPGIKYAAFTKLPVNLFDDYDKAVEWLNEG